MKDRLQEVAEAVKRIDARFNKLGATFRRLACIRISTDRLAEYLKMVFPEPRHLSDERTYIRAKRQMQEDRNAVEGLFETGKGNDIEGVAGTLWAAYNGVTEYVDFHKYKTGGGKWLQTIWFGAGDAIKTRAFDAALTIAQSKNRPIGTA